MSECYFTGSKGSKRSNGSKGIVLPTFHGFEPGSAVERCLWNPWNQWNPWNLCFKLPRMSEKKGVSRRDLLKRAGIAGAALTIPMSPAAQQQARSAASPASAAAPAAREPLENLSAAEADLLEAICARLIPSDASGPGAREARAAHYIDRALGGALKESREAYRAGLAAFDAYCRSSRRAPFIELSTRDQDSVLIDVETGAAASGGFPASSSQFFNMVRSHTMQGTFGDPYYGGNANFVGWDLIGYPGIRLNVTSDEQRLGNRLTPTHKSAYDTEMFTKAHARHSEPSAPSAALASRKSVADGN